MCVALAPKETIIQERLLTENRGTMVFSIGDSSHKHILCLWCFLIPSATRESFSNHDDINTRNKRREGGLYSGSVVYTYMYVRPRM